LSIRMFALFICYLSTVMHSGVLKWRPEIRARARKPISIGSRNARRGSNPLGLPWQTAPIWIVAQL
jgi:hypothetical protein